MRRVDLATELRKGLYNPYRALILSILQYSLGWLQVGSTLPNIKQLRTALYTHERDSHIQM